MPRIRPPVALQVSSLLAALAALGSGVSAAEAKRDVPDYDGRGNPDADAGNWALWVPRVVLSPLYAANEYVLRRPIGALITRAERDRWNDSFAGLFTFGKGDTSSIAPIVLIDAGMQPLVGLTYTRDDFLAAGNALVLRGATWGPHRIDASVGDRYTIDDSDSVRARFTVSRARDPLFVGLGPDETRAARARYGVSRIDGAVRYRRQLSPDPGHVSRIDVIAGVAHTGFLDAACCDDPSLDTRIARGEVMAPPGYREAYTAGYARVDLALDSRRERPAPGGGLYLRLHGQPSVDLGGSGSWLGYGGAVGGAVDLTGHRRTLRLQLAVDFLEGITGGPIPFTEYPTLGGERMPGFLPGWMTGLSTAAAQLGYTWPVWLGLDAETQFMVGNAFGDHLAGFAPRKLRMSGDVGLTTNPDRDQRIEILFGLGSETFEQGGKLTSLRVTIGTRRGF